MKVKILKVSAGIMEAEFDRPIEIKRKGIEVVVDGIIAPSIDMVDKMVTSAGVIELEIEDKVLK